MGIVYALYRESPVSVVAQPDRVLGAGIEHQLDLAGPRFRFLLDGVIVNVHDAVGGPDRPPGVGDAVRVVGLLLPSILSSMGWLGSKPAITALTLPS
jgi:hypothetical protein